MNDPTLISRWHFAFTIVYHYLFPQLTMGLAFLMVVLKTLYMRTRNESYNKAARFWAKIFAVTFIMGVVTGIPMEFQFGTNWAVFSRFSGGIIAQTLAMEGAFAFFLESAFVGFCSSSANGRSGRGCTGSAGSWSGSGPGPRPTSSWRPTPGCRTP